VKVQFTLDARQTAASGMSEKACLLYNKTYSFNGFTMDAITYSAARANLATTMNRVCQDHEPLIITRNGDQSVVMVSLEDYQALEETAYLLRNPTNARRLLSAAAQLAAGKGVKRDLTQ
jgi:antitoxin YefM